MAGNFEYHIIIKNLPLFEKYEMINDFLIIVICINHTDSILCVAYQSNKIISWHVTGVTQIL